MLCSTNLSRSGVNHNDDQPAHLRVKDEEAHVPAEISMQQYAAPETRFCPAKVYEYTEPTAEGEQPELVINAQNCVHCKCVLLGLRIDAYVGADFKHLFVTGVALLRCHMSTFGGQSPRVEGDLHSACIYLAGFDVSSAADLLAMRCSECM